MRRYQYRLNDQNVSQAGWGEITPLKYIETVPGETYGGTISVNAGTGLTSKMIKSRAYYDLYAFYCPIRLLWRDFPQFLASNDGDIVPPRTTNLFPQNFENDFVGQDGAADTNSVFLRRMYHMIFYTFFLTTPASNGQELISEQIEAVRDGDFDETNTMREAAARSSTLDESWFDTDEVTSQTVSVSNDEVNLDDIRRAYALDKWEKMRAYYGGRYTDLLKSYGIKADWGILQEPECIGISNNDFQFKPRSSSGDTNYGDRRGFFEGEMKLKLRKTFCPEHGIIAVYAVPRAEVFNSTQGAHILCSRDLSIPSTWYDPISWVAYNTATMPKTMVDNGATASERVQFPIGEHLRKGRNEMALPYTQDWSEIPAFSKSMTSFMGSSRSFLKHITQPSATDFESSDDKITHYTEVRVAKRSPLKPSGQVGTR